MGPVGCLLQTLAASLAALAQLSPNPSPGDQRKGQIPSRGCGLVPQVWSPPTPPAPARSVLSVLSVTPACVGSARVSLRHPLPSGVLAPNPAARCPLALKALAALFQARSLLSLPGIWVRPCLSLAAPRTSPRPRCSPGRDLWLGVPRTAKRPSDAPNARGSPGRCQARSGACQRPAARIKGRVCDVMRCPPAS